MVLAGAITSDNPVAGLYSMHLVPSHRRELQTAVITNTTASLIANLADVSISIIRLAAGTYALSAELVVTRSVTIEALVPGTVVLNAQANSTSKRRVLNIDPGATGVVQLSGLNITGGYLACGFPNGAYYYGSWTSEGYHQAACAGYRGRRRSGIFWHSLFHLVRDLFESCKA